MARLVAGRMNWFSVDIVQLVRFGCCAAEERGGMARDDEGCLGMSADVRGSVDA